MRSEIIVIGAGGHAKVCIEILQAMGEQVAFCIEEPSERKSCLSIPILNGDHSLQVLKAEGYYKLFVAIGAHLPRRRLAQLALKHGYELINAVSPHAMVSPSAKLGRGIAIMPGAIINADTTLSDLVIINTGASIDHDCQINESTHIGPQCAIAGHVNIGENSLLGIGCNVIPQITIGNHAVIGAGSVVISNIPSHVTAVGVPARIIQSASPSG